MHFVNAKSILSAENGMNIYRGCTHGCIYCDSRSRCYQMNHDFEDIEVKQNAPQLLEKALASKRKKCMIGTGAMCDPYMHCERQLGLTRQCLEVIQRYGFGLAVQTKSSDILRDLDLLQAINKKAKCVVQTTLTTFDEDLCRILEPNVSTTRERFEMLQVMAAAGIPTVVWLSPFLPWINDTEENLRGLLDCCVQAGVRGVICFGIGVTMRQGNREYFYQKLDQHFPGLRQRYHRRYGMDYVLTSDQSPGLMKLLRETCREHDILWETDAVFDYLRRFPEKDDGTQLSLF